MSPATEQVVQITVDPLLNGRPVTTLNGTMLVPWTVGIDKDDGYITAAAALSLKQTGTALPDNGTFPADAAHPEMVLHFSNAAGATSPQARGVSGVAQFEFDVPHATYSQLFLALSSSYGDSPLNVTLMYADATISSLQFTLPDWGTGAALPSNPAIFFNLISGLHKWNHDNASVDTPTHTITGVKLSPESGKELQRVQIGKSGAAPYLVFWGATGVATSAISNSNGGAGGAGGSGGAAGSASAGASGSAAGSVGVAGAAGGANAGSNGSSGTAGSSAAGAAGSAQAGAPGAAAAGSAGTASPPGTENNGCALSGRARSRFPSFIGLLALGAALRLRRASSRQ